MKRRILACVLAAGLVTMTGCSDEKYDERDFIGKTSAEIVGEYGSFDCTLGTASEDGEYKNTACGYTVKEAQKGFLGTDPEEILFIRFDNEGRAYECYRSTRPGG